MKPDYTPKEIINVGKTYRYVDSDDILHETGDEYDASTCGTIVGINYDVANLMNNDIGDVNLTFNTVTGVYENIDNLITKDLINKFGGDKVIASLDYFYPHNSKDEFEGEFKQVGIGKNIIRRVFFDVQKAGIDTLCVDPNEGTERFYRSVGFFPLGNEFMIKYFNLSQFSGKNRNLYK